MKVSVLNLEFGENYTRWRRYLPDTVPYEGEIGVDLDLQVKGGPVPPGWSFSWVADYVRRCLPRYYVRASARQSCGGGVHVLVHRVAPIGIVKFPTILEAFDLRLALGDDPSRLNLDAQRFIQSGNETWVRGVLFDRKGERQAQPWRTLELPPATPKEPE